MTVFSSLMRSAVSVCALWAVSACATTQTNPTNALTATDNVDAIVARLNQTLNAMEVDGLSGIVAVSKDGDLIFSSGYGAADAATGTPFTIDTQVDIGSITKTFTGMATAGLIANGVIAADDTLVDFFINVPDDKAAITVQHLLTHTAGFPDAIGDDFEPLDRDAFLTRAFDVQLISAPGERYVYSNVGFSVLAAIIETATGETYENHLIDTLLTPAGITDTGYARAYDTTRVEHDAHGRSLAQVSWGGPTPHWNLIGNGGIVSTARNMVAWRVAYGAGDIVSPSAVALSHTAYVREGPGAPSFYGYGLVVEDHPSFGRIYWHNGGNQHFTAHWRDYANNGLVVFAATNSAAFDADAVVAAVTGALFDVNVRVQGPNPEDDGDWDPLSDTPVAHIAQEFLSVIAQDDPAAWRTFIETRATTGFVAFAPMDRHMEMFAMIHADLATTEVVGARQTEPDTITVRLRRADTGDVLHVDIAADLSSNPPRFAGLNIQ